MVATELSGAQTHLTYEDLSKPTQIPLCVGGLTVRLTAKNRLTLNKCSRPVTIRAQSPVSQLLQAIKPDSRAMPQLVLEQLMSTPSAINLCSSSNYSTLQRQTN